MKAKSPRPTGILVWYGATVFLSSGLLLVLEIVAGRLLAPYVGVSLYTWTSIIGVILAGLSLGNWLGGHVADRGAGEGTVGITLLTSAVSCFAILSLLMLVAEPLQTSELSLLSASFVYVLTLFFVPAVLLGIITPLLTTLALSLDSRPGHVVGRMHALAALGSIAGTFVTGYWLVQTVGTKNIVIGTAAALVMLSVPFIRRVQRKAVIVLGTALLFGALVLMTQRVQGFVNPCDRESNYYCVRVVDEQSTGGEVAARSLVLDHMTHSTNVRTRPDQLWVPYVQAMDELVHYFFEDPSTLDYFFAGGGAYTHPRALRFRYPDAAVTVSELDPVVTDVAQNRLFFDSARINIIHGDARLALLSLQGHHYDVIVTDVFHDLAIPYHLTTLEYHRLVKSRLSESGLYLLNVVDIFPDARLVKAMLKTLRTQFRYVDVWLERPPDTPGRLTYVLSASNKHQPPDTIASRRGAPRVWYAVTRVLESIGTSPVGLPVLTDDFAPVENLISPLFTSDAGH